MRSVSRLKLTAAVLAAVFVGASLPATASANHNDDFADASLIALNKLENDNNVDTTIEPPEAFTYSTSLCEGQAMGGTVWWKFTGDGRPVTVSTKGSTVDTVLAVWANGNSLSGCSDDVQNSSSGRYSELRMNTTNGTTYWVQAGGLCVSFDTDGGREDCNDWREGNISIAAWALPGNDARSSATPLHDHHQQSFETRGAREDGEGAPTCGASPFGKTVWFRFDAPSKGKVHLTANGFDTVMAVYDGAAGGFLKCHDDPQVSGPSHVVVDARPGQTFSIQVGGYGSGRTADAGSVDMLAVWEQDTDWDDDGSAGLAYGGGDCQDENPAVEPGIDDIPNNDVDDNCDNFKDYDRDGDGYRVTTPVRNPKPTNWDCDDRPGIGARIHPGTRDVRGNALDEDCSGSAAKALGLPSSITDSWAGKPGGASVASMKVKPALKGSKVKISCSGGGCPFRSKSIPVRRRTKALVLTRLFKGRVLRSGAKLVVKVLPPTIEWIGRSESYRIRGSAVRAGKACWNVRGRKVRCPS